MTTFYTSLLGLALPATGDLTGTWGDTVNTAITALLDTAVAGTTTLNTDADITLTTTTGAANQARAAVLLHTATLTANRSIIAPAQSKAYVVINSTTGGFSVTLKGVGPTTGVLVSAGKAALCVWNGSDFALVASSSLVDLASGVTGVLPIANGGTGAASAAAALTALGAAALASPTFTGTPAAPTATPGTSTTQLATTAFTAAAVAVETVRATAAEGAITTSLAAYAPLASPTLTGTPAAPTATPGTSTTQLATTAFVGTALTPYAPLASPALTGTPTAPTATVGTNTTQLATTAFVTSAITAGTQTLFPSVRTSNTILGATDRGSELFYTSGTFSQTLTAAATLGNGWYIWAMNTGSGVVTWDPNGAETIGGATTAAMNNGDVWLVACDGSNFQLTRINGSNKQVFTSGSNTLTVPAGVYRFYVEAWGAGGGATNTASAHAGGGGGYVAGWQSTTPGSSVTCNVGAGSSGASGGNTVCGSFTANGGTVDGAGGTATGGSINIAGGVGCGTSNLVIGGTAMKGAPAACAAAGVLAGTQPGAGGATCNSAGPTSGGDGLIVVIWT